MPTSTDLVTDLPADFEVFGQAVDTSLAELKGGTTGQVLSKTSNTDMDFTWVTTDDANAIQNSIVDAKGDIVAASANDTPARLAVGNNGETLVADSSTATGLRYTGNFAAGKNAIINGAFNVWQRGTSFSGSTYNADRWVLLTDATVTSSQQSFTAGTAPVAGYEGQYFQRTAKSAGGSYVIQEQRVEDVRIFAGQTVTLSFWAKADATVTVAPVIGQFFGSGGSASVDTSLTSATLTTSWVRYSMTASIPSISGKTIGTNSYLFVRPVRALTASATTIDIWGVQLEAGSVATAFQTASGGSPQAELAMCQRYYARYTIGNAYGFLPVMGYAVSTTTAYSDCRFIVPMRTAPSAVEYGGNIRLVSSTDVGTAMTSYTLGGAGIYGNGGGMNTAGSLVAGGWYKMQGNNDATAYVGFTAEL